MSDKKSRKILYLGLDSARFESDGFIVHHPLIKIVPKAIVFPKQCSHIILTSRTAVWLLFEQCEVSNQHFLLVGDATAALLKEKGDFTFQIAQPQTQEGIIPLIPLDSFIFYPHSSLSRPLISNYLKEHKILHEETILYDTVLNKLPPINPQEFDEIVFTSPSTVSAFLKKYGVPPLNKKLTPIGPITQKALEKIFD